MTTQKIHSESTEAPDGAFFDPNIGETVKFEPKPLPDEVKHAAAEIIESLGLPRAADLVEAELIPSSDKYRYLGMRGDDVTTEDKRRKRLVEALDGHSWSGHKRSSPRPLPRLDHDALPLVEMLKQNLEVGTTYGVEGRTYKVEVLEGVGEALVVGLEGERPRMFFQEHPEEDGLTGSATDGDYVDLIREFVPAQMPLLYEEAAHLYQEG